MTQILNTSGVHSKEALVLDAQNQMLHTNSLMMHHDAITGTHTQAVGDNYKHMMLLASN